MSKAVLISIRPEWVQKIGEGKKTIEVRRTRPKLQPPFKCYIYCTLPRKNKSHVMFLSICDDGEIREMNGKVVGEFVCDRIDTINPETEPYGIYDVDDDFVAQTGLVDGALWDYGKGATLYGWHISDLRIYDMPRDLGEFQRATDPCDSCHAEYTWECTGCKKLGGDIKRPPQSWCYVEEG